MRKSIFTIALLSILIACQKENATTPKEPEVSTNDIEALRQEIDELKTIVESLKPGTGKVDENESKWASVEEFENLKKENEELKSQIQLLTSGFFEVEGLRFNKNGDVISTPKIESNYKIQTNTGKLTMSRTFDEYGRLIETYGEYSEYSSIPSPPYYWQRVIYSYNGKTVQKSTETSSDSYGIYTNKETTETTYW